MPPRTRDVEQGISASATHTEAKDDFMDDIGNKLGPCDSIDTQNHKINSPYQRQGSWARSSDTAQSELGTSHEPNCPEHGGDAEGRDIDGNLVSWDGPDDPEDPRNWPRKRKWSAVVIVSLFTLMSSMTSSMVAPALDDISRDLGIKNEVLSQMSLSVFLLAYGMSNELLLCYRSLNWL